MAIEIPQYEVLTKEGAFELRLYKDYVKAEVSIKADDYSKAINEGFRIIADFIFGNNTKRQQISMTAPVIQSVQPSEHIAMTAPVNVTPGSNNVYTISFIMPSKYTLSTLPVPNNKQVTIKKVAAFKAAVIRFSGFVNDKIITKKTSELEAWTIKNKLKASKEKDVARYDPPWTPWFFRRNEIIIHLNRDHSELLFSP
jgi:hypothetical protein